MAKGVRITNRLPQFAAEVERKATRAVTKMVITGAAHASLYTPIDTSTLLNSQFKRIVQNGSKVIGIVGYTAGYAAPVHDPVVKQTFRRATAKKEFLRLGFEESADLLRSIVQQEMKV
jgi:phage tail sheath protein FI